ncbi:AraC family transcriptional regulator [Pendulispora albinea]|uniref:AraC family transcriptional regulator n=1 Tax=Pendulispora albinea TaxID=2741071 RepID=A0ABZ2LWE3_9BACT
MIRSQFLPLALEWMKRNGARAAADEVQCTFALPEPSGERLKEYTISVQNFSAAVEQAATRANDDFLGIHVAQDVPRGSFGLAELAARHSPDVGAALRRAAQYARLVSRRARLTLHEGHGSLTLVQSSPGDMMHERRHANEFILAAILRLVRESTGELIRPTRIEFAHGAPSDPTYLERYFGTKSIRFDANHNAIAFEERIAPLSFVSSDPVVLPWLDHLAHILLPPQVPAADPVPGLRDQIRLGLDSRSQSMTLPDVARRMALSTRTLQRRLGEAGTTYQAELDTVRRELALFYVRDPRRTMSNVARLLGFDDVRSFARAFLKWYGLTPSKFRQTSKSRVP